MKERKKLWLDKILDGDVEVVGAVQAATDVFLTSAKCADKLNSQRFVVDEADTRFFGEVTREKYGLKADIVRPPYESFWVEENLTEEPGNVGATAFLGLFNYAAPDTALRLYKELLMKGATTQHEHEHDVDTFDELVSENGLIYNLSYGLVYQGKVQTAGLGTFIPVGNADLVSIRAVHSHYQGRTAHMGPAIRNTIVGLMTMINVKNAAVKNVVETPPDLAKSRAKRGKRPLNPYTYLHSHRTAPSIGRTSSAEDLSPVLTRGHFKDRATGTYWWNPYVAMRESSKDRKAYVVKSTNTLPEGETK